MNLNIFIFQNHAAIKAKPGVGMTQVAKIGKKISAGQRSFTSPSATSLPPPLSLSFTHTHTHTLSLSFSRSPKSLPPPPPPPCLHTHTHMRSLYLPLPLCIQFVSTVTIPVRGWTPSHSLPDHANSWPSLWPCLSQTGLWCPFEGREPYQAWHIMCLTKHTCSCTSMVKFAMWVWSILLVCRSMYICTCDGVCVYV